MLKTQKVFWWRTGCANTEGELGKEPDGEMGSRFTCMYKRIELLPSALLASLKVDRAP